VYRLERSYIDSKSTRFLLDEPLSKKEISALLTEHQILKQFIQDKLKLSQEELQEIIGKGKEILLPISIFKNKLSTLEIVVKYLHEHQKLTFAKIAGLLNRDQRTIWHAYQRAVKKKIRINIVASDIRVPISIFSDRKYSALEALVAYLRDSHSLKFTEIAALLDLNMKTVWTVYRRGKKKDAS